MLAEKNPSNDYQKLKYLFLKQKQSLPLHIKEQMSLRRIKQFYEYYDGNVYVSYSGGKDSTVLLYLVRSIYPEVPAVFSNTGLEFPEIIKFVKETENVIIIRPKLSFREVIEKYGYPVISKEQSKYINIVQTTKNLERKNHLLHDKKFSIKKKYQYLLDAPFKISNKCCDYLKKNPMKSFEKETGLVKIVGIKAGDSFLRRLNYIKIGCNSFNNKNSQSNPLSFWLDSDIWKYIRKYNLDYCNIYDLGVPATGCVFCGFGVHLEKSPNRFERLKILHPRMWEYCVNKLGFGEVLDYMKIPY